MSVQTAKRLVDALDARQGLICVVGAGGKKTTLLALLEAHTVLNTAPVLVTSSVHLAESAFKGRLQRLIVEPGITPDELASQCFDGAVLAAASSAKSGRLAGLPTAMIQDLARRGGFALVLVKADGARMRLIKAPALDEPVLPAEPKVVIPLVSARAFGRPLDERTAHRPEQLAAVVGASLGEPITPHHVARLLASPKGALQRVGAARVVPVINGVDTEEDRRLAMEAARAALAQTARFDRIVLARMIIGEVIDVVTADKQPE